MSHTVELDIAVVGGGVAGLWLLNRLDSQGYQCALFEKTALGSDQTVASQGMIHGGIKYTLSGTINSASEAIADMPAHWRDCLAGKGDVDLRRANTLSDHFYMFSSGGVASRVTTFFASKAMRGRIDKVKTKQLPEIFQHRDFNGQVYRLADLVLDVPSVVTALANNIPNKTFLLPEDHHWRRNVEGNIELDLNTEGGKITVRAKRFIFTAGKGNGELLKELRIAQPAQQIRPLHQVLVKLNNPHPFFGHCLGADKTPRLTISSHKANDGKWVWYLGGTLAEKGVEQTSAELIKSAKHELSTLMPWLDISEAQWSTLRIDRAEPRQQNFVRPDKAFVGAADNTPNLLVAWPTKLTLSPNLATETLDRLNTDGVTPSQNTDSSILTEYLKQAPIAQTPWSVFQ